MGDYDPALECGQRALTIASEVGTPALRGEANFCLGQVYYAVGDYRQAMGFLGRQVQGLQGEAIRERFGMSIQYVYSRTWLAWCLAECGEFADGTVVGKEAIEIAEALDRAFLLAPAYAGVGVLHLRQGNLERAIPMLERGLTLCQAADLPLLSQTFAPALGSAYALSGRVAEAVLLLEQAVQQGVTMSIMGGHSLRVAWLGEAYLLASRIDDAKEQAVRAIELSLTHRERGNQAWALRLLGEIASHSDSRDVELADGHYRQALALAGELEMRPLVAHCHMGLGRLYRRAAKRQQAQEHLTTAMRMFREMDMRFWLEKAEADARESA
jgi:tetratricopeptide (TPR) repeat protein